MAAWGPNVASSCVAELGDSICKPGYVMETSDSWFLKQWVTSTLAAFQCVALAELPHPTRSRQTPCPHQHRLPSHAEHGGWWSLHYTNMSLLVIPPPRLTCLHFK